MRSQRVGHDWVTEQQKLEAGKGKETKPPLPPPERKAACWHLALSLGRPVSDFWTTGVLKIINLGYSRSPSLWEFITTATDTHGIFFFFRVIFLPSLSLDKWNYRGYRGQELKRQINPSSWATPSPPPIRDDTYWTCRCWRFGFRTPGTGRSPRWAGRRTRWQIRCWEPRSERWGCLQTSPAPCRWASWTCRDRWCRMTSQKAVAGAGWPE